MQNQKNSSPIPTIYKNPITRKTAEPRAPAITRPVAGPRRSTGFLNDGKMHVVLDTNVFINALGAHKKGSGASTTQKNCLEVIQMWKMGTFSLGFNGILFDEYRRVGERMIKEGKISSVLFDPLMKLFAEKSYFFRMVVTKQHVARSYADDHLFDGISADYLVSEDMSDVRTEDIMKRQQNYKRILSAKEFLVLLKKTHNQA